MTTADLREAVKAVDAQARVSKVDDGHWTIRTQDSAAVERLFPSLGLRLDPRLTDVEGSRWDWITVLHVFEGRASHATKRRVASTTTKSRTFHVPGPDGSTFPIILRSTQAGFWRTVDGDLFQYLGHAWLGDKGNRYRIEKWAAPHTDRTFTSLQSALNAWARTRAEKKSPAQLDADIAEVLGKETP